MAEAIHLTLPSRPACVPRLGDWALPVGLRTYRWHPNNIVIRIRWADHSP
jgi:hypothetical protein